MTFELMVEIAIKLVIFGAPLVLVPGMVILERRVCAFVQKRVGPNRVGPFGLLQTAADGIKNIFKEDVVPEQVDRLLYILAPVLGLIPVWITFALIPWGHMLNLNGSYIPLQVAPVNAALLFVFAILSLEVYGVAMGGWASNSKFSLLGGLRASAQMVSYEIAMGLVVVSVLMVSSSMDLNQIIYLQTQYAWNIVYLPVGFLMFLIAGFAETNRLPFDLAECEAELVGGYHTEYSSMKFALFFLTEYISIVVISALTVILFLGGWHVPFTDPYTEFWFTVPGVLISVACFAAKVGFFVFLFVWVRWTLPRFRYDQLMSLGWKVFIPIALVNIAVTALLKLGPPMQEVPLP
jgi:NADH-quinone oxidoreductase subunit H